MDSPNRDVSSFPMNLNSLGSAAAEEEKIFSEIEKKTNLDNYLVVLQEKKEEVKKVFEIYQKMSSEIESFFFSSESLKTMPPSNRIFLNDIGQIILEIEALLSSRENINNDQELINKVWKVLKRATKVTGPCCLKVLKMFFREKIISLFEEAWESEKETLTNYYFDLKNKVKDFPREEQFPSVEFEACCGDNPSSNFNIKIEKKDSLLIKICEIKTLDELVNFFYLSFLVCGAELSDLSNNFKKSLQRKLDSFSPGSDDWNNLKNEDEDLFEDALMTFDDNDLSHVWKDKYQDDEKVVVSSNERQESGGCIVDREEQQNSDSQSVVVPSITTVDTANKKNTLDDLKRNPFFGILFVIFVIAIIVFIAKKTKKKQ